MPTGLGDEKLWLCPTLDNVTPFNDLSDQANNGTAVGGLSTVADTSNGGAFAYDFDGVDDHIDCGQVLDVNYDDSASYSFWINPSDGAASFDAIMGKMLSSGTYRGHLVAYRGSSATPASKQNGITFILRSDNTANRLIEVSAPSSVTAGQWQQVVVTYDGSSSASGVSVYVDGVSISTSVIVDSQGTTTTATSAPYCIGTRNADSVFFNGSLDDLRQYSRVLTQAEIAHLAEARGITGSPPQGLGDEKLWLCPSINNSPNDISGNGNGGIYQGSMGTVTSDGKLAYDFDGTDDYIDCGDILPATSGGQDEAVTYSSWMKFDSFSNNNNGYGVCWMGKCDVTSHGGWTINSIDGRTGYTHYPNGSNGSQYLGAKINSAIPLSTWVHVAVTYSGCETTGCTTMYIDGVAVSIGEPMVNYGSGMGSSTDSLKVGTTLSGTGYKRMMNGQMDDIRIYNRVLSQDEITHLATSRGIEGPPPVGLGDEKLWLCPSLNDSANDISGNGNNGVYQGGMGTVTDVSNGGSRAYDFDGVNDNISTSFAPPSWITTGVFSLSSWVKYDTIQDSGIAGSGITGTSAGISNVYDTYGTRGHGVVFSKNSGGYAARSYAGDHGSAVTSQWYHVLSTGDGTDVKVYVDGVLSGTTAIAGFSATGVWTSALKVGNAGSGFILNGRVDDVRAFDRTLTQAEITHLATSRGIEGAPTTCNLITDMTYWSDFDDAASSMADENGGSDTLDATLSPAVISSGSPRSSDCTNIVNAYYSLNSGASQPAPPSDYSFSIWARCTGTGSTGAWIANQRKATPSSGWHIFRRTSNGLISFAEFSGGAAARIVEVTPMSLNTWYLLSFSRTDAGLYAYVNGSLVGSDTTATTQGTEAAPLVVGGGSWDPSNAAAKYNGYLWSCGMWDRELTAAEHLQLYAGGQGLLYSELCDTPPTTGFYNPFINKIFNNDYTRRIR